MTAPRHPQPTRRDLNDPRSFGSALPRTGAPPVLNDRRSTRRRAR